VIVLVNSDSVSIIMVYDITRKESFIELQNYWHNHVKENANPSTCKCKFTALVIVLAANKSDDFENEEIRESEAHEYAKVFCV
jgi:GTPase SAR1 family protein